VRVAKGCPSCAPSFLEEKGGSIVNTFYSGGDKIGVGFIVGCLFIVRRYRRDPTGRGPRVPVTLIAELVFYGLKICRRELNC
jgi:hypothetical protein